ncbi:hypothetical protein [Blastococcus sp. PRF04-17]|uniref:hypothetical protein n=1 Tax=Blastococcus sp. PRF04-17 TaxID=2933797 RepID=UPI001FF2F72F|nr:hypothetical protein [Blastococcus sp. PRF04-17]UOY02228.1 hypothetical protein MVA48_02245 [Blastococcus sp. PRF04-17]
MPASPTSSMPFAPAPATAHPADTRPLRTPAALVTGGALGVAVTTALEVLTAPYGEAVVAYPLNGAVHLVKVAAAAAFVTGMLVLAARLRGRLGRGGVAALAAISLATLLGAVPYSLVEASLDRGLAPAAADARLEEIYAEQAWLPVAAVAGMLLLLVGVVTLAVVALRRRVLPRWAPLASLLAVPVAVLAGIADGAGLPVPHPPAWVFLGLSAYGLALLRRPAVGSGTKQGLDGGPGAAGTQ